jgi:hypothetical protein
MRSNVFKNNSKSPVGDACYVTPSSPHVYFISHRFKYFPQHSVFILVYKMHHYTKNMYKNDKYTVLYLPLLL